MDLYTKKEIFNLASEIKAHFHCVEDRLSDELKEELKFQLYKINQNIEIIERRVDN